MIINDANPRRSLYYLGAVVLDVLTREKAKTIETLELFRRSRQRADHHDFPFSYFVLALDWLYILGAIKLTNEGDIEKCF
jgi:hypothetical protein